MHRWLRSDRHRPCASNLLHRRQDLSRGRRNLHRWRLRQDLRRRGVASGRRRSRVALDRLLDLADAESESSVWIAPRSAAGAAALSSAPTPGFGVVRLTDLIMSHGAIDAFVRTISRLGDEFQSQTLQDDIAAIVHDSVSAAPRGRSRRRGSCPIVAHQFRPRSQAHRELDGNAGEPLHAIGLAGFLPSFAKRSR